MQPEDGEYIYGYPGGGLHGVAFLHGALTGSSPEEILAEFTGRIGALPLLHPSGRMLQTHEFTIFQLVDHFDGTGGDDPLHAMRSNLFLQIDEFRYRYSTGQYTPRGYTYLEAMFAGHRTPGT